MAKIKFTEKTKGGGDPFDGVLAEYAGRDFSIEFYGGDTRAYPAKLAAVKMCLDKRVRADAAARGIPLPEVGE